MKCFATVGEENRLRYDAIVVGAGPTGLACGIEIKRAGLAELVIDKGCVANSLFHYPTNMVFFTTPERMEIGDLPLVTAGEKATRAEALKYYRLAAERYELNLRLYERVEEIARQEGEFRVRTQAQVGSAQEYRARNVVLATGYYDLPNRLGIPGEDLPKVSHYYTEAHPYFGREVAVIGGGNSAAEAALDLFRHGARTTLIHRGAQLSPTLKYWILPDLENRIKSGEIRARLGTRLREIRPDSIVIEGPEGKSELKNDFVFALTGYHPDFDFLGRAGVELGAETGRPKLDAHTLESNVPGLFLAGVVVGGRHSKEIFIENGRHHGKLIARAIRARTPRF